MDENQNNGQTATPELPKSDHDYRISNGDKVSLIGIDIYSSPDLSQKEYGLYRHDGTASRPLGNERYQSLAEALQAERGQIKSEIERGAKVERKEREGAPKTENKTPITRTQKDKPEYSADKPHHQSKDKKQSDRPDNKAPEQEGKKVEDTKPNPEKRQDTRGDSQKPQSENENGINWGTVAESAGSTILKGAGIAAAGAGLVALGAVSAPFLIGAGLAFSIGMGVNTFFTRANEAMDAGEDDYLGNAAAAGISDMVPLIDVVGIGEAATGFNYMTGQEMTQQERSEKLGGVIGGAAMDFIPVAGVVSSKAKKSKSSKQLSAKEKKMLEQYDEGITSFTLTNSVKNKERHHAVLQALFKRLKDPEVASFIHAGPSLPMTKKLHQQIHKELNEILRSEGFMNRANEPKNELSKAEFREALQTINEYYYQKANDNPTNTNYSKLSEAVTTFILTLEKAGLI